jgi:hypothetical protein
VRSQRSSVGTPAKTTAAGEAAAAAGNEPVKAAAGRKQPAKAAAGKQSAKALAAASAAQAPDTRLARRVDTAGEDGASAAAPSSTPQPADEPMDADVELLAKGRPVTRTVVIPPSVLAKDTPGLHGDGRQYVRAGVINVARVFSGPWN